MNMDHKSRNHHELLLDTRAFERHARPTPLVDTPDSPSC
jgi:hypothetical protein